MIKNFVFESLLKLDIQYFADEPTPPAEPPVPEPEPEEKIMLTEKELQSKIDSETDKRVAKALETRETKMREKIEAEFLQKQQQQKDLSQLSEEERKIKEFELAQTEFEKEKQKFEFDQQVVGVKSVLQDKSMPIELAEFLVVQGDNDATLNNINVISESIEKLVGERIKTELRQNTPQTGGGAKPSEYKGMGLYSSNEHTSLQERAKEKYKF